METLRFTAVVPLEIDLQTMMSLALTKVSLQSIWQNLANGVGTTSKVGAKGMT